jgi:hypothetical protein
MNHKKRIFISFIALIGLIGFISTYGKWEYLSYVHGEEFVDPIQSSIDEGCLLETPIRIKVMKYSENQATVFMQGESESTYLLSFSNIVNKWSLMKEWSNGSSKYYCNYDVINSTMGGSADGFYWY